MLLLDAFRGLFESQEPTPSHLAWPLPHPHRERPPYRPLYRRTDATFIVEVLLLLHFVAAARENRFKRMMRFCRECNNMLYPRENRERKRLEYVCKLKDCNYVERNVENSCVFVNELIKDSS